jgi:thiamine-phosphate diphosphorylase
VKPRVIVIVNRESAATRLDDADFAVHLRFAATPEECARVSGRAIASVDVSTFRRSRLDGIHLGGDSRAQLSEARRELGPDVWISVPAHTDDDVDAARRDGATAVYVSPIFTTPGKGPPRGLEAIRSARTRAGSMLIYALGGVDASNAEDCVRAGADGVAVIRAAHALRELDAAVRRGRSP